MKRLLIVTTVASTLRAFLLPFACHFRAQGWQVDATAQGISNNQEYLKTFDRIWEVEWSRNPFAAQNLMKAPQRLREVVNQGNYNLVHVHTPVAAFVTRYALNSFRQQKQLKIIYTAHGFHFYQGGNPIKNAAFLGLEKIAGSWTDYLVVINREDEAAAKQYCLLAPERIRYMPGIGVDLNHYSPDAVSDEALNRIRVELRLSPETPLFLSVAEFIPRKRHRDILVALSHLSRPQVHLAFAGTGRLMEEMQQLAIELNIKEQVHFLGRRQDIPALMRASVATVLVSEQEGLPRCVMESLCMETPAIGTRIRGTQDLLANGCGLLVDVGDHEGLAQAMAWILDHPEEARMMGRAARKQIANYDLQHILKLHEYLYADALQERSE